MLELRDGKFVDTSQTGRLGLGVAPFAAPEKPWWNFLVDNPIMWLLEKFNRPQQAIFSAIEEALSPERERTPGAAAWESFVHGDGARFVDIMDELGIRGQAGKFDALDILAGAGEVIFDPINLIGVGALSKFGKGARMLRGVDMAAVEAKAMPKLVAMMGSETKAASALEKMRSAGVMIPGGFEAKIAQEAARLAGPEAFSHYLSVGVGKYKVSVPGTQKLLEPMIKGGRWVRDRFRGALSTQPRSYTEAMPQALVNVIERHKAGTNQLYALWAKRLPKEWTKERLATAIEKGIRPAKEAGEAVQEAYELGIWLSDYLPQLEEMKGVMTATYGKGVAKQTTFADLLDAQGLDPNSDEAINYFIHALHPDVRKYKATHDIRFKGRGGQFQALEPRHPSQMMRTIDGDIQSINEWARETGDFMFHPKGELLKFYKKSGRDIRETIERDAVKFIDTGEVTDAMASLGTKLGVGAKTLFKDVGHRKTFEQFFVDDWAQGMALRIGRHTRATAVSEMMKMMMDAKNELGGGRWARPINDAPADWVRIIDDMPASLQKRLAPDFIAQLDNTAFDPEMATALTKGLRMMYDPKPRNEALGMLRKGLSWVRASTILPFAGYHVANVVGNRWGRYLMGVADVQYDVMAGTIRNAIRQGDMAGLRKMNFTLGGRKFTGEQIMHEAFFADVMAGGSMTAEVAGYGRFRPGAMDIGEKATMGQLVNPLSRKQLGGMIATNLEDHDRLAGFIGRLNKGDDVSVAAAAVEKHLFRYTDLTDIEAGTKSMPGIKDATLFYTWYRKNIGLTLQKMWEYPGRLSLPIKVRNALDGAFGDPDSEYAVPSYLKDQFYFYLGKDVEGKPRFLDPEKYLPPLSAAKFFTGGLAGAGKEAIGMLIPPIKAVAEAAFGKEAFTGRELEGVPGEKRFMFGKEISPAGAYFLKNIRMLNTINRTLFPAAEGPEGRVRAGEPGERPPGALGTAVWREYAGVKLQKTDVQRNRYFQAISPGGDINAKLDKIASKMAGKVSPLQRESYMTERTKLLWEKAEVIRQMIEDGSDPFTGKPLDWEPPMPDPGTRRAHSMRQLYTEMHSTLRGLFFGEPPVPGILLVEQKTRLTPDEAKQTFDTMTRVKLDMLGKDANYAVQHKKKKIMDERVFDPIRDILRTPDFYERREQTPSWDTHLYDYPLPYRQSLVKLFYMYLESGYNIGLYDAKSVKLRMKNFREDYEIDYR